MSSLGSHALTLYVYKLRSISKSGLKAWYGTQADNADSSVYKIVMKIIYKYKMYITCQN